VLDEDIAFCMPKQPNLKKHKTSQESKTSSYKLDTAQGTKVKEAFKKQAVNTYTCKISPVRQKIDKKASGCS
jgi:hypothetical protein